MPTTHYADHEIFAGARARRVHAVFGSFREGPGFEPGNRKVGNAQGKLGFGKAL
ncbi:hypothetical protein [Nocardia jinanensis]|uniref:hypothetical protein n=1 Tax=Nocardia jinanensis TaxID=382504 RepID=UPI000A7DEA82|nr:hypothetical protein [Nocardia jinanensis]